MTYLELVKAAVAASDTSSPSTFDTLEGATDYVAQAASFVSEAWKRIQMARDLWDFRVHEFEFATVEDQWEYEWNRVADLRGNRSITERTGFHRWLGTAERGTAYRWLMRVPANDYVTGTHFPFLNYRDFRFNRLSRSDLSSRPTRWTVSPAGTLQMWPAPTEVLAINGLSVRGVQTLRGNNDEPFGIEEAYQDLIKWKAVQMLHEYDEAFHAAESARMKYQEMMRSFERAHLPQISVGAALA